MAIREVVAASPTGYSVAGRVTTFLELAQEVDKFRTIVDMKLSLLAEWIEQRHSHQSAAYTVVDETVIFADATGGAFAITLPPSVTETINRDVHVKRVNAGANTVTVTASGSDTIDGIATYVLTAQYMSVHCVSDGLGKWHII
jgi:hypothetical protein